MEGIAGWRLFLGMGRRGGGKVLRIFGRELRGRVGAVCRSGEKLAMGRRERCRYGR